MHFPAVTPVRINFPPPPLYRSFSTLYIASFVVGGSLTIPGLAERCGSRFRTPINAATPPVVEDSTVEHGLVGGFFTGDLRS